MNFNIYITLFNFKTGEEFSILLPEKHLPSLIAGFCLPQELEYNTLVDKAENTFGFEDSEFVNVLFLNKTLINISQLEKWEQQKIADLFSICSEKDLCHLVHCYNIFRQYSVIEDSLSDVYSVISELVLLSLFPTSAIDIVYEIPPEERGNLYFLGQRLGLIKHIGTKYYVGDCDALERLLEEDTPI